MSHWAAFIFLIFFIYLNSGKGVSIQVNGTVYQIKIGDW